MNSDLLQSARRALVVLVLLVVAPLGVGCQATSCQSSSFQANGVQQDGVQANGAPPHEEQAIVECPKGTEDRMSAARMSASKQRASSFLELVEYEPANLAPSKALAILSYPQAEESLGRRSFIYDQALALLWYAWTGQRDTAQGLAEALIYLQNPDGSWGFSFDTTRLDDYHASYVRSGTVAWAAHALNYAGERFAMPRALRAAGRGADFLRRMRLGGSDLERGLVSAGYGTTSTPQDAPPGPTLSYAVTEHQFDAHVVLSEYEPRSARRLAERMLEVLWMDDEGRFAVAASSGRLNTRRALDAAGAWGALWLWSIGDRERAERSYRYALEHFQTGSTGSEEADADEAALFGFRPYEDAVDGYDPRHARDHIFVEGTMSMGLAAHRLGDEATAQKVLETGVELSCRDEPGLAYSNVEVPGFSTRAAAASTLWFLFLERELSSGRKAPLFDSTDLATTGDDSTGDDSTGDDSTGPDSTGPDSTG
jgi:hypothetical protein